MTDPLSSTATAAGGGERSSSPGAPRFYARNGDVFLTSAWGGYFITPAERDRMLALWRTATGDLITDTIREDMADELEAVMAEAAVQTQRRAA